AALLRYDSPSICPSIAPYYGPASACRPNASNATCLQRYRTLKSWSWWSGSSRSAPKCDGRLDVHHVVKGSRGGSGFDLDRLVALCRWCHDQTDAPYERRAPSNRLGRRPVYVRGSPAGGPWHTSSAGPAFAHVGEVQLLEDGCDAGDGHFSVVVKRTARESAESPVCPRRQTDDEC